MLLLHDALDKTSIVQGSKIAVCVCGHGISTYADLSARSTALARGLVQRGLTSGDRVGIVAGHNINAIVLFWAVLKASGVVVWLSDQYEISELQSVIRDADPKFIFVETSKTLGGLSGLGRPDLQIENLADLKSFEEQGPNGNPVLRSGNEHDLAAIVYTSGSSGKPKGVCLSHRNLLSVATSVIEHMPITPADSYLMVVPLHYVHGLMQLLVHAVAGCTIHFARNFIFPRSVVQLLQQTGVTGFSGVPYHFNALIDRGGLYEARLPKLRWITVTGGKLPSSRIVEILDNMQGIQFHIAYGQTECAPRATALNPGRIREKPDSVGSPIPGVKVWLLDDDNNPVQDGETGEVVVEGPNVMIGYWRDPDMTKLVLDNHGRLHTGDLGRFDADGDLFLVGRKSEMIKCAGERIIPEELEKVLTAHESVSEAVVVGMDDALLGQKVVAHIILDPGARDKDEAELIKAIRAYCLEHVPFARAPREYRVWSDYPRKSNGKPDRTQLSHTG